MELKVDVLGVEPSKLLNFHFTTGDAMDNSISNKKSENVKLKKRIRELENTLNPRPLFAKALVIVTVDQTHRSTPRTSMRVRKYTQLLSGVRSYVVENINKMIDIISHTWEVSTNLKSLSQRITNFTKYLKRDLEHDEGFHNNEVNTFIEWVTSFNDHHIS